MLRRAAPIIGLIVLTYFLMEDHCRSPKRDDDESSTTPPLSNPTGGSLEHLDSFMVLHSCDAPDPSSPIYSVPTQFPKIPIFIITHNKLIALKSMLASLNHLSTTYEIIIHDNNSTYRPFLDYLTFLQDQGIKVIRSTSSLGAEEFPDIPQSLLNDAFTDKIKRRLNSVAKTIAHWYSSNDSPYYVVSDCDIELPSFVAPDLLEMFAHVLKNNPKVQVVGPSLIHEDIPSYYPLKQKVLHNQETPYFQYYLPWKKAAYQIQMGYVDTTFGMYRKGFPFHRKNEGLMVGCPYCVRHLDWYINPLNVTEDVKYNFFHSSKVVGTWGTNMLRRVIVRNQTLNEAFGKSTKDQMFIPSSLPVKFAPSNWMYFNRYYSLSPDFIINTIISHRRWTSFLDLGFGVGANLAFAGLRHQQVMGLELWESAVSKMELVRESNPSLRHIKLNWTCIKSQYNDPGIEPIISWKLASFSAGCIGIDNYLREWILSPASFVKVDAQRLPLAVVLSIVEFLSKIEIKPTVAIVINLHNRAVAGWWIKRMRSTILTWPRVYQVNGPRSRRLVTNKSNVCHLCEKCIYMMDSK
eukprot:NODE_1582_length_1896_cov_45.523971_g1340_i0.p1 GENE.NODE_1582_length_1896_cov_45.523971_g1340_i0~~NODE_1582_length_1896_cov_45.523971_g1340_i0.p1  ORF type:complete len:577 (+),score=66.15 NODE_1582_length_1896_cov_45.523971_g1340_i0:71-1801(+)